MNDHAEVLRKERDRLPREDRRWKALDAAIAALEAGRSVPVAWEVQYAGGSVGWTATAEEADDAIAEAREGATKRPLYAAAPQQPPPVYYFNDSGRLCVLNGPAPQQPPPMGVLTELRDWCDKQESAFIEEGTTGGDVRASAFRAVRRRIELAIEQQQPAEAE